MALPVNHPNDEVVCYGHSPSIGASPIVAEVRMPFSGTILKYGVVANSAITTADCSIAVALTGTTITGSPFTLPLSGAAAGQIATSQPTAITSCIEDDVVSFTPSGASGTNVTGSFFVVVSKHAGP